MSSPSKTLAITGLIQFLRIHTTACRHVSRQQRRNSAALTNAATVFYLRRALMKIEQVFERAQGLGGADRWTIWRACGTHDVSSLPTTEPAGERRPIHYCEKCWTLFGPTGQPLNAPFPTGRKPATRERRGLWTMRRWFS